MFHIGYGWDIRIKRKGVNGSYCSQYSFNYEGISNALCGRVVDKNEKGEKFTPLRIQVIQMEMIENQKQIEE